jgi:uncharacterized protein DUF5615
VKFKLDENLPASSLAILTGGGHDVDTVRADGLTGAPDEEVVAGAAAAGRILITLSVPCSCSAVTGMMRRFSSIFTWSGFAAML